VSSDGRWLYYSLMTPGNSDIARVSLIGEPEVEVLLDSPADELNGKVSADGRFFGFQSNETGSWGVYVMEIASRRRWIISADAGYFPIWTRNGNQILFSANGGNYSVDVRTEPNFSATEPALAFDITEVILDASRDGERLLFARDEANDDQTETRPRVIVVMNWFDKIEERTRESGSR
jgi:Tol biopolymer transport system component